MKKLIAISTLLILFISCRSVKKEWVKENFTEKSTTQEIRVVQDSVFKSEISKLETSISKIETSVALNETRSEITSENESTTVSGSITAEDGKEKSVTIGSTTIKSKGANVTFETSSTKEFTKQFESHLQELETRLQESLLEISILISENNSIKSEFANFKSTYDSEKTSESKTVKKSGLSFGTWLILIIIIIGIVLIWYFKKSIPFL